MWLVPAQTTSPGLQASCERAKSPPKQVSNPDISSYVFQERVRSGRVGAAGGYTSQR
jgi:hypothetical protein